MVAENIPLEIVSAPENYVGSVSDKVSFTVEATGNGLTYEWFYSANGGETWSKSYATGYMTNTLEVVLYGYRDGYMYKCVVSDVLGNKAETAASMVVGSSAVVITAQPQNIENAILGQLYHFTVEATGENLTYRWELSTDGGETWQESWNDGYEAATLNVRMNANRDGNLYRCVVTSGLKVIVTSEPAILDLQDPSVEIVSHPTNAFLLAGEMTNIHVEATGMDLTYQWHRSDDGGITWERTWLPGCETATLCFDVTAARAVMFKCKVTDGSGTAVWSNPMKLTLVSAELAILSQPTDVTCAIGETAVFTVVAQGDGLKYQWYVSYDQGANWEKTYLGGSETNELSFEVNEGRATRVFKCVITDVAGNTVETNTVKINLQ